MTEFEAAREAFGARLRALREARGVLSGRAMAKLVGWPQSRVSKIETGRQTPDDTDVIAWCDALGIPEAAAELLTTLQGIRLQQLEWRRQLRTGMRHGQTARGQREQSAKLIRAVDIAAVPGLIQTAPYARRVLTKVSDLLDLPKDVDQAVAARMSRQQVLYQDSPRIELLMAEAALAHPIATPSEMVAQIERLIVVTGMPTVRFGILPLYRTLPYLVMNGFWIVDDRVAVETTTTELMIDDPEQVATYHRLADRLWKAAAEGDEAREILLRLAEEYRQRAE
ncbi:helix-turn-helix transcriptional regulator [Amycolatopsis cynarae]|uniref:Helix-turn-helix transcriptional regulator n=1 Tax=Amycolatopsis cynarae TaxID=2995223 RepID=A0ABY7B4D6_9PSEU|nr:helix-turn-helix transcriptional regulator [Amycolatopsis sp. HUAS 11-8]WAL67170.1 helix-turn-helix transcriptional regulator [Amycolatopsis sp. HUAS 11-8]